MFIVDYGSCRPPIFKMFHFFGPISVRSVQKTPTHTKPHPDDDVLARARQPLGRLPRFLPPLQHQLRAHLTLATPRLARLGNSQRHSQVRCRTRVHRLPSQQGRPRQDAAAPRWRRRCALHRHHRPISIDPANSGIASFSSNQASHTSANLEDAGHVGHGLSR